ncbi:MAG TPA: CRTAC1 family protein [Blastocatellia bacterium]|nr:CRTAC1 family protein [Blastocatellia bacterium]
MKFPTPKCFAAIICGLLLTFPVHPSHRPEGAVTQAGGQSPVTFTDVTKAAGINFVNYSSPDKKYIVESMGGGVAFFDFDNDGRLDIYLVNSFTVEGALNRKPRPKAALYRNLGNGKFEEVAEKAGVADPGWAMGVAIADYDNDGFDDLYVTCFGPNRLYHNRGDGTFEDVTKKAGVGDPRFSTGAAWGDYDRDGKLDLFVTNYVDFNLEQLPEFGKGQLCLYRGIPVQCGPRGLPGAGDTLYHNNGDGTFTDVSKKAKVDDPNGYYGLGVMWTDFDDDGWPDIYVANDATPNYAYRNNHDGTFTETGLSLGVAVNEDGIEQGSMGLSIADYDRDGRLDIIVTNFADDYNTIYHKNADGTFTDVSRATKTADVSMPYVGWGTKFFDYDNDGWLDLLVVNGHVYPQIEGAFPGGMYRQRMLFYRNLKNGTFAEVAAEVGGALTERRASRGAAFGDYDDDGDLDVIVNNLDGPPVLLRNDGGNKAGNWISLRLTGTKSNRNAIGARVTVKAGGLSQVEELHGNESYLSHSDWRLHFGLGKATVADEITIQWPSGRVEKMAKVKANQVVKVTEK